MWHHGDMKKKLVTLLLCLALLPAMPDLAPAKDGREDAGEAVRSGKAMSISRILKQVRPRLGEILEIELEEDDGRLVYEIRYMTREGRRREAYVDARTGRILSSEDDD